MHGKSKFILDMRCCLIRLLISIYHWLAVVFVRPKHPGITSHKKELDFLFEINARSFYFLLIAF